MKAVGFWKMLTFCNMSPTFVLFRKMHTLSLYMYITPSPFATPSSRSRTGCRLTPSVSVSLLIYHFAFHFKTFRRHSNATGISICDNYSECYACKHQKSNDNAEETVVYKSTKNTSGKVCQFNAQYFIQYRGHISVYPFIHSSFLSFTHSLLHCLWMKFLINPSPVL